MTRPDDSLMETYETLTFKEVVHPNVYEGDLVEGRLNDWPPTHRVRGKAMSDRGGTRLVVAGDFVVGYNTDGGPGAPSNRKMIRVIERAARPFYVNVTQTQPVAEDVFRLDGKLWVVEPISDEDLGAWAYSPPRWAWTSLKKLPIGPKTLLVDGVTGRAVTS